MKKYPSRNLLIAGVFYLLVVLPHEQVGHFCAWLFDGHLTRNDYNGLILAISMAGLLLYVYTLVKNTRENSGLRKLIFFYLAVTVVFTILCFKLLIVINIEVVHFVQYGAMAFLLFPLVKRYGETVFWATLMGAADEGWQYIYLAPAKSNYYDFNDVIINLLGAVFGLLLVRSLQPEFALQPRWQIWKSPAFYTSLLLGCVIWLSLRNGWLHVFAPATEGPDRLWSLIRVAQPGFWTTVHPQVTFHVVQPVEGLVITGLLLLLYAGLGWPGFSKVRQVT